MGAGTSSSGGKVPCQHCSRAFKRSGLARHTTCAHPGAARPPAVASAAMPLARTAVVAVAAPLVCRPCLTIRTPRCPAPSAVQPTSLCILRRILSFHSLYGVVCSALRSSLCILCHLLYCCGCDLVTSGLSPLLAMPFDTPE